MDTILTYRESPAVNQSQLKKVISIDEKEPDVLPGRNKYMEEGDVFDAILTLPKEYQEEKFLRVDAENRPGASMDRMISYIYENRGDATELGDLHEVIEQAIDLESYIGNANWDTTKRIEKVIKECTEYWDFLISAEGKTIVLRKDWERLSGIAQNVKTAANTAKYFSENRLTTVAEYQMAVYATMDEVNCKGLLDKCIFNEQSKQIQPIDFKLTATNVTEWKYVARRNRADFQAAFYTDLLKEVYPDYEVLPFVFIVASSNPAVEPYVYVTTETDLYIGRHGASKIGSKLFNEDGMLLTQQEDLIYGWHDAMQIYKDAIRLGLPNFDLDSFYANRTKPLNLWN